MSFAEAASGPAPSAIPGTACSIRVLLSRLSDKERNGLQKILDNSDWNHKAVWRLIAKEGHSVPEQAVGKHRRGDCACPKQQQ